MLALLAVLFSARLFGSHTSGVTKHAVCEQYLLLICCFKDLYCYVIYELESKCVKTEKNKADYKYSWHHLKKSVYSEYKHTLYVSKPNCVETLFCLIIVQSIFHN